MFRPIQLIELASDPAIDMLRARRYRGTDTHSLAKIAEAVGRLPLALESLAIELGTGRQTARGVLERLEASPNAIQLKAFEDASGFAISRQEGVFQALVGPLIRLSANIRHRIESLGYVGDSPISPGLMEALLGVERDSDDWDATLAECQRESVVEMTDGRARVHALTAAAIAATNPHDAFDQAWPRFNARLHTVYRASPVMFLDEEPHYRLWVDWSVKGKGAEHPDTLGAQNNLAAAYRSLGRHGEAIHIHQKTLRVREQVLGREDPDTLDSRNNLANAYRDAGEFETAIAIHKETLQSFQRLKGSEDPRTIGSKNNLASAYFAAGRKKQGFSILEETVRQAEEEIGRNGEDTLMYKAHLGLQLLLADERTKAMAILEETLSDLEDTLGQENMLTLSCANHLAACYGLERRFEGVVAVLEPRLPLIQRVCGKQHSETERAVRSLAEGFRETNREDDARRLENELGAAAEAP